MGLLINTLMDPSRLSLVLAAVTLVVIYILTVTTSIISGPKAALNGCSSSHPASVTIFSSVILLNAHFKKSIKKKGTGRVRKFPSVTSLGPR